MTFTIPFPFICYWLFAIVFEAVYIYIEWQKAKKQIQNSKAYKMYWPMVQNTLLNSASIKFWWNTITGLPGMIVATALLLITAPALLPLSVFSLLKKAVGYKSSLEKAAQDEEESIKQAEVKSADFMKTEGVFVEPEGEIDMPPPPPTNS